MAVSKNLRDTSLTLAYNEATLHVEVYIDADGNVTLSRFVVPGWMQVWGQPSLVFETEGGGTIQPDEKDIDVLVEAVENQQADLEWD